MTELVQHREEARRRVRHHAARPDVRRVHAETRDLLIHVEDGVPLAEAVHQHAHRAELEAAGAHPHEVGGQAGELGHDHAQRIRARRHLNAHQLLHRERVGEVVDRG